MKFIFNIILIILIVVLQTSFVPEMKIFNIYPNLILLIFLSLIFIDRNDEALWWAGLGGIFLDLTTQIHFGVYTISMVTIYIIVQYFVRRVFSDPPIILAAGIFFISSILLNIYFMVFEFSFLLIIMEATHSAVVGCVIYFLVKNYLKSKETFKI